MVENSNMNPETAESPDVDELESLRQEINSIDKSKKGFTVIPYSFILSASASRIEEDCCERG